MKSEFICDPLAPPPYDAYELQTGIKLPYFGTWMCPPDTFACGISSGEKHGMMIFRPLWNFGLN